jgi:hypothetical protein
MTEIKENLKKLRGWFPADFKPVQAKESRQRSIFRLDRTNIGFISALAISIFMSVNHFLLGDAIYALFVWFACIVGFSLLLNFLAAKDAQLNTKLMLVAWFIVLSLGGTLVNVYLFLVPTSFFTQVFSLTLFAIFHVPFIVGLTAYFVGKKEVYGKILSWFQGA